MKPLSVYSPDGRYIWDGSKWNAVSTENNKIYKQLALWIGIPTVVLIFASISMATIVRINPPANTYGYSSFSCGMLSIKESILVAAPETNKDKLQNLHAWQKYRNCFISEYKYAGE